MVYLEYERFKVKYLEIQNNYNDILTEKENLFTKTQPNAIRYDKENVQGGTFENGFDEYLIAKESKKIDERLNEARQLLDDREKLLRLKEDELRKSRDRIDVIYVLKYIDGVHPSKIAKNLNYSKSQVYRMLSKIQSTLRKDATKCD